MAGRISCCLNLPLLDSNSTQSSSQRLKTTSRISRRSTEDDETEPRKNKCSLHMAVAATVLIGAIQISNVPLVEAAVVKPTVINKETASRRWSDKRACPPWLQNSLETIVPENLPRPSSHRRLELAGLGKRDAPPVGVVVTRVRKAGCFSM